MPLDKSMEKRGLKYTETKKVKVKRKNRKTIKEV